jgi:hypothetical protein
VGDGERGGHGFGHHRSGPEAAQPADEGRKAEK